MPSKQRTAEALVCCVVCFQLHDALTVLIPNLRGYGCTLVGVGTGRGFRTASRWP